MIKAISIFFAVFVFLLTPSVIVAQGRGEELRQQAEARKELVEQRREEIVQRIEEKRATREARLAEMHQQRIGLFWGRLMRRLMAAMDRLEILIGRIESRLVKFEEENPDEATTAIHAEVDEAKEMLSASRVELEAADATINDVIESEDPKAAFEVVRDTILGIKMDLVEIHTKLVMVIGDIKGLRVGVGTENDTDNTGETQETENGTESAETE